MKVCTDSCLLGAWVAAKIEKKVLQPENILDIGSGTGLLSLMLAQKSKARIDAIEIDENSYLQTKDNFNKSKWANHLHAFHSDIKNWTFPLKYDLIISNPPFFENDLKSDNPPKNLAKHHDGLNLNGLLQSITHHLAEDGKFALLLPYHRITFFKKMAADNHFFIQEECLVQQTPAHSFFRGLLLFSTQKEVAITKELIIKAKEGNYTQDFDELLQDYYL